MNKLRRRYNQISFPAVDKTSPGIAKGTLPGNMMGYKATPNAGGQTGHVKGTMPGNMMAYPSTKSPKSFPAIADESQNYGNKRLSEPTRSGFGDKTIPPQMKNYTAINADNPEWVQIQSVPKKKGAFYGK